MCSGSEVGLVFKAHRLCVSLNSRLESNTADEEVPEELDADGALAVSDPVCLAQRGSRDPTPYTLHLILNTLPTPYTLHPTPYTLHPTPYGLRYLSSWFKVPE